MNRRQFLQTVTSTTILAPAAGSLVSAKAKGVHWPVGCFNRPWTKWSFDDALTGVKTAGYNLTGLLSRTKQDPFIGSEATPEYLANLKQKLAAHGLKANMGALNTRHNIPLEDSIKDLHKQIDNAAFLSLEYVLSFGVDRPEQVEHYYKVMAAGAAYAQKRKVKLAMKPHGGSSGASDEILRSIQKVAHPNFKIWYDAGNIIYYTGKDPVTELKPIAKYVTGFCAKDCAQQKTDVMIQFGTGKVDFKAVFGVLKGAGFKGPVMVECCALSDSKDVVTANARANREFLEKVLAEI
jgi:sugar phosphate isomerase/epimerase